MRGPEITINDLQEGVVLSKLQLGDFFRFPASAQGAAYVVILRKYDKRDHEPMLIEMSYRKLDDGELYSSFHPETKMVNKLRLTSAHFELEAKR